MIVETPAAKESNADEVRTARSDPRIRFVTDLSLRTDAGVLYTGQTNDVSLTGAFLKTGGLPQGISQGDKGVAAVTVREGGREFSMAFPCVVARVTNEGLGLNFEDPEEEDDEDDDEDALEADADEGAVEEVDLEEEEDSLEGDSLESDLEEEDDLAGD